MKTGVVWKDVGETPLQALRRFRTRAVLPESVPLSYSGRLDPMAEGKILVLVGDECKNEKKYRQMDKEYEVEILLCVKTDTGDVLGVPKISEHVVHPTFRNVRLACRKLVGTHHWHYPHYSSKPVQGKPLHMWAREGRLHEIELPRTVSRIVSLKTHSVTEMQPVALESIVISRIRTLQNFNGGKPCTDFRQPEIERKWSELFSANPTRSFVVIRCTCIAGSGTYMRTLAEELAKIFGTEACALSIKRTRIGRLWSIFGLRFWYPRW